VIVDDQEVSASRTIRWHLVPLQFVEAGRGSCGHPGDEPDRTGLRVI